MWHDLRGLCALVLAVGLSASIVVVLAVGTFRSVPLSEGGANLLSTVAGGSLAVISLYIGGKWSDPAPPVELHIEPAPEPEPPVPPGGQPS